MWIDAGEPDGEGIGTGASASAFTCGEECCRLRVGRGGADRMTGVAAGVERAGETEDMVDLTIPRDEAGSD